MGATGHGSVVLDSKLAYLLVLLGVVAFDPT